MRSGVRLGIDVGRARIGVSRSDPLGHMSIPLETVKRDRNGRDIERIAELATEREVIEIVVGWPAHMRGGSGESAADARRFALRLKRRLPQVRLCLVDERLSSKQAHSRLTEVGLDSREQKSVVDQVAAQIILDQALEIERQSGILPGVEINSRSDERKH